MHTNIYQSDEFFQRDIILQHRRMTFKGKVGQRSKKAYIEDNKIFQQIKYVISTEERTKDLLCLSN